jgi:hypothetical protein
MKFASTFAHAGANLSWRDDLLSFCYMLLYLLVGELPWKSIKQFNNIQDQNQKLLDIKINTSIESLCKGLP